MIAYATLKQLFSMPEPNCEYEILNELKDLSNHCDANCLYHTRFLLEPDKIPLTEQYDHMTNVSKYCRRITFSGNHSLHHIIEFAPKWEDQCAHLYKEIHLVLNEMLFNGDADPACSNPARLTRRPGAVRSDNGNLQKLEYEGDYLDDDTAKTVIRKAKSLHIAERLKYKPQAKPHVGPKHDGMCRLYEVVTRYLQTPFPKMTGNGHSSAWLYAAIACCMKYNDMTTLEQIKAKAFREHWTMKELDRITDSINTKKRLH